MAFDRETGTGHAGLILGVAAVLATGVFGLGGGSSAQATTVSTPGFNASVTATVAPTRLPAAGGAPVRLTIKGTGTRPDPTALSAYPLHLIDLKLDRQITVDTTGLPTCTPSALKFVTPAVARRKCGGALIGTGEADLTMPSVVEEGAIFSGHFDLLFFNGKHKGRPAVLMYRSYTRIPGGIAWPIGNGRRLRIKDTGGEDSRTLTSSFDIRIGKTWRFKGQRHSFLNARCATGAIRTGITLTMDSGQVSKTTQQQCVKRR